MLVHKPPQPTPLPSTCTRDMFLPQVFNNYSVQIQAAWVLKMRALTGLVFVEDLEDDDALVDSVLDSEILASVPRPGTSLRLPVTGTYVPTIFVGRVGAIYANFSSHV